MIENVLGKKDNIITQSIRMKFLSCLETSLINHQMVIRGGICLGFEPLTTLRVNLLLCGHIREIPVRNRKCVKLWREQLKNCIRIHNYSFKLCRMSAITDYGHPVRKLPSLHGRKSNPNPKFLGTAEAYFVCHISPSFQISLIFAFTGCP